MAAVCSSCFVSASGCAIVNSPHPIIFLSSLVAVFMTTQWILLMLFLPNSQGRLLYGDQCLNLIQFWPPFWATPTTGTFSTACCKIRVLETGLPLYLWMSMSCLKDRMRLGTFMTYTVEPLLSRQSGTYHCSYLRNVRSWELHACCSNSLKCFCFFRLVLYC